MHAHREIIDGNKLAQLVNLPDGWKAQKLEIVVWPVESFRKLSNLSMTSARGGLKAYAKPELMMREKELGWELAIKDKYAKS